MKIYIGFFEGNHWAVPEGIYEGKMTIQKFKGNRIECDSKLTEGLKPGDQLPECREKEVFKKLSDEEYNSPENQNRDNPIAGHRRIILVPVEDELDKLEKSIKRYLNPVPVEAKQEQEVEPDQDELWYRFARNIERRTGTRLFSMIDGWKNEYTITRKG